MAPTQGRLDGLEARWAGGKDRRKAMLSLSGGGYRAALFHLGALTRLNELGLLAGIDMVGAVAGGSILAALLATRVPWPLSGAYRDWPEAVAEPMREISRRNARARAFLRGPIVAGATEAALEERYARRLVESLGGEPPERPRFIFGGAGLVLGEMGVDAGSGGAGGINWEIGSTACPPGYTAGVVGDTIAAVRTDLDAFGDAEQAVLENHGYLLADAAIRGGPIDVRGIEPLPPEPPHPHWMDEARVRAALAASSRRTRLGRLRAHRTGEPKRVPQPTSPELTALLQRHRPFVHYDSLESYRADSAAAIAEVAIGRRRNTLHRRGGELIAAAAPTGEETPLSLDFLAGPVYANGEVAHRDDYLDECGGTHAADASSMRRQPNHADIVYGHARHDEDGRLWLQYWFFYYYNDKGLLGTGLHEGDWEMVQLRLGDDGVPDAATYGQHAGGERAEWAEVEQGQVEEGPVAVVYPARGSHASRFRAGSYAARTVPDHNDGLGPRVRPRLAAIADNGPGWVLWPGRWGATRRREAFESDSLRGPREQLRWWGPAAFHREARPAAKLPVGETATIEMAPPAPRLMAHREGDCAVVTYSFPQRLASQGSPGRIVAATYREGDPGPPLAQSFMVEAREGSLTLQIPQGSTPNAVRVSAASTHGVAGTTIVVPLI
jgi:patatin-like phospholipase